MPSPFIEEVVETNSFLARTSRDSRHTRDFGKMKKIALNLGFAVLLLLSFVVPQTSVEAMSVKNESDIDITARVHTVAGFLVPPVTIKPGKTWWPSAKILKDSGNPVVLQWEGNGWEASCKLLSVSKGNAVRFASNYMCWGYD